MLKMTILDSVERRFSADIAREIIVSMIRQSSNALIQVGKYFKGHVLTSRAERFPQLACLASMTRSALICVYKDSLLL